MDLMISTETVARFLGVTRPTVIKYIQDGRLIAVRSGKAYKIARNDLENFAREMGMSSSRISELDKLAHVVDDKRTRSLDETDLSPDLEANYPPLPLIPEPDVLYFVAVCTHAGAPELIFRVHTNKYFIGRHSLASLSIQDPYVSSLHATLIYDNGFVRLLDQSTNGTHVRSAKLHSGESHVLGDGDQIRVAGVVLTLISASRIEAHLAETLNAEA